MPSRLLRIAMLLLMLVLAGCSSVPENTHNESHPNDPLEGFNRAMWKINYDYLDPYLARPVSLAYVDYVPSPLRRGLANFLSNLDEPASMVNNLIMGNGEKALDHFNRFWLNSTFGLLGLIDIASEAGIRKHDDKQFGDAIGYYGVGNGPYLMVPGYGPYTVREVADTVDGWYVPLAYLNIWGSIGKWAVQGMETRAALVPQEAMLQRSPDPYALTREVYLQRRDFKAERDTEHYDTDQEDFLDDYLDGGF
ncbi:VacJ family lipoprotein [Vibrio metschnikovii]|uniref:MlaA family lipoprotein n=1 Tax=Vibrio metschnikovii TaxID=28172 RepID=UPI002A3E5041|nr:VacJ family lipoprotein [Vibrio metschnikovii]EKO3686902.1 VacJ family lipoprotein [Vibrio metschnikovii]EKO3690457.1 VacJ family lipoprotein [Vibrio metschnikovii]EKO3889158.1 VacJ family lipoprotein [Vibrio metschnikovii]